MSTPNSKNKIERQKAASQDTYRRIAAVPTIPATTTVVVLVIAEFVTKETRLPTLATARGHRGQGDLLKWIKALTLFAPVELFAFS